MTVRDVQAFLKNLAALLSAHQGTKPGGEFDAFAQGLEPFADWQIAALAQFLREADEYRRTGVVAAPAAKKGRASKAAKPAAKLATAKDGAAVEGAVARLRALHDRFDDASLTQAAIESEVERIGGEFDANGLKAVARAFGLSSGLTTKAAVKGKILGHVLERRERHERSRQFSAVTPDVASEGVTSQ